MDISEKEIKKIQAKKYINVKEFAEIYNMCKSSQAGYRGRLNEPLPYHQKVERGKIIYNVVEVEIWIKINISEILMYFYHQIKLYCYVFFI